MSASDAFDQLAPLLRRAPDLEAADLVAADASDRLILSEAGAMAGPVAVVGDRYGALTLSVRRAYPALDVRSHQDPLTGERALTRNAEAQGIDLAGVIHPMLSGTLFHGVQTVLMQLPRELAALAEIAELIAAHADPVVRVIAGGRVKHMTLAMNEVLGRSFRTVTASRAVSKSRVLHAAGALPGTVGDWPRQEWHPDLGLTVCAHGAAFAGTRVDRGTRLLLSVLEELPGAGRMIDLGCGTGVLAAAAARLRPDATVIATDRSAAAVASARATLAANELDAEVIRDDGLASQVDASADVVLLNPPFHSGAAVTEALAPRLFREAARVLRPGGELWCVWNSHLRYRPALERLVGHTRQLARNTTFTVTVSRRR